MNILAFAASNSSKSINKQLVTYASTVFCEDIHSSAAAEFLDLNDYEMPIYSSDREETDGIPDKARQFREKMGGADALLISFAEHNGTYCAAYKNLFDWLSRIDMKVYQGKPAIVLSASPGKGGGARVLQVVTTSASVFGMQLKGSLAIAHFYDVFDQGHLVDSALNDKLRIVLQGLKP